MITYGKHVLPYQITLLKDLYVLQRPQEFVKVVLLNVSWDSDNSIGSQEYLRCLIKWEKRRYRRLCFVKRICTFFNHLKKKEFVLVRFEKGGGQNLELTSLCCRYVLGEIP